MKKRAFLPSYKNHPWSKRWVHDIAPLNYYPFSLWRIKKNLSTEFINTTSEGLRYTPDIKSCPNRNLYFKQRKIHFFGGSTIFGDGFLRDIDLIPFKIKCLVSRLN